MATDQPLDQATKDRIDAMSYYDMLRHARYAPAGDPMFSGETARYFSQVMRQKKEALTPTQQVMTSKEIGWVGDR